LTNFVISDIIETCRKNLKEVKGLMFSLLKNILKAIFTITPILALSNQAQAVSISLVPSSLTINPGDEFNVDIVLNNPSNEGLVGIGIWIKYDKNFLNVLDADTGNWITSGVNILDGPYHDPFDLPGDPGLFDNANDASIDGEIRWDARRSFFDLTDIYPSGTFATITFQAESQPGTTQLDFYGQGTGGYPDTYVVNENSQYILAGTTGADVTVIPEPLSILLFGLGLSGLVIRAKKTFKKAKIYS
jgi:hypothetical protein